MHTKNIKRFIFFPFALALLIASYLWFTPYYKYEISVIMPVYNTEKYLPQSIKSVLNQSFKDFEFIIINDGSTDNSLNIIKKYAKHDKRIKIINMPQNSGLANTRNEGLQHIHGKYVIFADSDDYLLPDMLQKLYTHAIRNNLDIVLSGALLFDEQRQQMVDLNWQPFLDADFLKKRNLDVFSYKDLPDNFFQICTKYTWNKLIKSSIIQRNRLQFQDAPKHDDSLFITKALLLADRIGYVDEDLYVYRINRANSISYQNTDTPKSLYDVFAPIKDFLKEKNIDTFLQKSFNKWITHWLPNEEVYGEDKLYLDKLINLMD